MTAFAEFSAANWARIARDWRAWWAGELERPLVVLETLDPTEGLDWERFDDFIVRFPLDLPAAAVLDYFEPRLEASHYFGDAFPKWWPNFGPGIAAAFLGAAVEYRSGTAWFAPRAVRSLPGLHLEYDAENMWWRRVREMTRAAAGRWGGRVVIGHTDLGGNLDILASLRGTENLLLDLYDAPDQVERLTSEITRLWLRYHAELAALIEPAGRGATCWAPLWFPTRGYILQSDFSYMISPAMFDRFVLPDLAACCEALNYTFYHLDGVGQIAHLDRLLALPRLRGIQWIPGAGQPPAEEWLPLLKRIRAAGKLCQVEVDREGALAIRRALGGRGFVFQIAESLTPEEAEAFLRAL